MWVKKWICNFTSIQVWTCSIVQHKPIQHFIYSLATMMKSEADMTSILQNRNFTWKKFAVQSKLKAAFWWLQWHCLWVKFCFVWSTLLTFSLWNCWTSGGNIPASCCTAALCCCPCWLPNGRSWARGGSVGRAELYPYVEPWVSDGALWSHSKQKKWDHSWLRGSC